MLIGVVGKKFSGKDTMSNYLRAKYSFLTYAYALPLKQTCKTLFLLSEDQMNDPELKEHIDTRWNKTPRELLQFLGTDIMRNQFDKNFWIKYFNSWYENNKTRRIVVSDCRFQNEVDAILDKGGVVVKVVRKSDDKDSHESEQLIDQITGIHYVIHNDSSLADFYQQIDSFMEAWFNLDV